MIESSHTFEYLTTKLTFEKLISLTYLFATDI